jgi:hypothetical protein
MNNEERTLGEALDLIDSWSEQMNLEIECLSPDRRVEYFKGAQARLEKKLGRPVKLAERSMPEQTSRS